jgi:hypothetical protein
MASYILRNIDVDLWARIKVRCQEQGITPTYPIDRLLRDWLAQEVLKRG